MACTCTPTQALDKIQERLIRKDMRVVGVVSLELYRELTELIDTLSESGREECADELAALRRHASRGMCTYCGSYDECPCDDRADYQSTGGY